ncbi:facilitated trehalose transporter Tret1-like [Drosophila nasuta]|uniref:Facilitated trehalose transporter Tret1-like n=1 Tax=Drosophila albomicans TaxID=7291 RepID=A0A6P8XXX1_DROAB|nr:facilitated trehalose transporter Tret1-like [Drosophila albomicans]XP_060657492.1 facilitated trehalose transporter Tret1-like [Drosophila nasuta]
MGQLKQYVAGLSAAFGAFCLGAALGWSGPMEKPVTDGKAYCFSVSRDDWGWITSLLTLGAACMCIPIGILIGLFGRKLVMLVLVFPFLIGWCCIIWASSVYVMFVGRFIIGACGGAFCVTAPMYTTEIAEVAIRGIMGCFFQLWIVHGILYGFGVGALCKPKTVNILCGILPIIFFIIFIWMPESPVFLVQKEKSERADKAMKWLRGKDADYSADMNAMVAESKKEKPKVLEGMMRKASVMGMCISITLMFLQQFTGINAIIFYATSIFQDAGTGLSPDWCTVILGIAQVIATILAILSIEKAGRKMLLLVSAAVMGITTLVMAIFFQWLKDSDVGWLPVLATCLFIVGFSIGFGPVPWLIMAELFAEDVKPVCGAIAGTCNWLFAFCVTKCFPLCLDAFGAAATFCAFAVISFLACVFIFFLVPETKGKTLNEIQEKLGS